VEWVVAGVEVLVKECETSLEEEVSLFQDERKGSYRLKEKTSEN
jgi:hypothetical protein